MRMRKKRTWIPVWLHVLRLWQRVRRHTAARGARCLATKTPCIWKLAAARAALSSRWRSAIPEVNFVAIEREEGALIMATERAMELGLPNLRFLSFDAAALAEIFSPGEVDRIYLNFSDPWPPNRQRRRRLTHADYLDVYDAILKEDGDLCFKTDNQRLFEWSISSICEYGWLVQNISLDLHHSELAAENIMTEYEQKFSEQGFRIYRLEARRRLPQFMDRRRPAHRP